MWERLSSRDRFFSCISKSRLESRSHLPPSAIRRPPCFYQQPDTSDQKPVTRIHKINPQNPDPAIIQEAAIVIKQGGVIAFPTRCLYGLGADAFNAEAVERIFKIKQRPAEKPILLLIDDPKRLKSLVIGISDKAEGLMERFWPGRLTLVFDAGERVPGYLTAGSGKIGIRQAGHPVSAALAGAIRIPLTGTSANLSGQPGCHRIDDLSPAVTDKLDLILDAGPLEGGDGSTVVDVTAEVPRVLRESIVRAKDVLAVVESR